jgi:superoxide reductase
MCDNQKFFICELCGNLIGFIENKCTPISCCGQKMTELVPNTEEASVEKHLPDINFSGNILNVQVGSALHPMTNEHYIPFICVKTEHGVQRKFLKPGDAPKAEFSFVDDKPVAVYAYCNLHGIWKTEIK